MLSKYVSGSFSSYEDFYKNFRIKVPARFNFAYDVVDGWAKKEPGKRAMVWCDDAGNSAVYTFADMKRMSDKAASFFSSLGIRRGDPVMLILKRRAEFWFACLALHKLGAIAIPATHLLTEKDIVYRAEAADIKAIISVSDPEVITHVDNAQPKSPTLSRSTDSMKPPAPSTSSSGTSSATGTSS
jgi:acetyl-CoA synthetase